VAAMLYRHEALYCWRNPLHMGSSSKEGWIRRLHACRFRGCLWECWSTRAEGRHRQTQRERFRVSHRLRSV